MKITYFFIITLQSFSLPVLYGTLIIVHHYHITKDMREMLQNEGDYPDEDPLNLKDLEIRQSTCNEIKTAREYRGRNTKKSFETEENPRSPNLDEENGNFERKYDEGDQLYEFTKKTVRLDQTHGVMKHKKMNLLECVDTPEKNWFVGFSRRNERMYLIDRLEYENYSVFKWIASIESLATYNTKHKGPQKDTQLAKYFSNQVDLDARFPRFKRYRREKLIREVSGRMTLCSLSFNEHVRLCSVTIETLFNEPRKPYQHVIKLVNHVNITQSRCLKKRTQLPSGELVRVHVIPCAINRDQKLPLFFILGDREQLGAAFVLTKFGGESNKLKVKHRLENISVLLAHYRYANMVSEDEMEANSRDSPSAPDEEQESDE